MPDLVDSFAGEHRFLSNFYPHPLVWDGEDYPSGEAAYHAGKTLDPRYRAWIAAASSPHEAKARGRRVPLRPGWDDLHRHTVMQQVIAAKFSDPELGQLLRATGTSCLIERNTWHDQICAQSVSAHEVSAVQGLVFRDDRGISWSWQ